MTPTFKMSMRSTLTFTVVLFSLLFVGSAHKVDAAASSQSEVKNLPTLGYFWNYGPRYSDKVPLDTEPDCGGSINGTPTNACGWSPGLSQGTYGYITYATKMYTVAPDGKETEIADKKKDVPVGTKVRIKRIQDPIRDVFWFGTGDSNDSPYGNWKDLAAPVTTACVKDDEVTEYANIVGALYKVYILLNVDPVNPTFTQTGGLTGCVKTVNKDEYTCTVNSKGTKTINAIFPETYGYFYYRYYGLDPRTSAAGCRGNNVPMRTGETGIMAPKFGIPTTYFKTIENKPYKIKFPAKTLTNTFTATQSNRPPAAPTITDVNTNNYFINNNQSFTISATDPDGDQIYYEVDTDNNGTADQRLPSTVNTYVNSGMAQNLVKSWPGLGIATFKAQTIDENGTASAWTTHTITLVAPTFPTVVTQPATENTPTTVTLNGTGRPNGQSTTGWFRYSTDSSFTCDDNVGTRAPVLASSDTNLKDGKSPNPSSVPFSQALTNLKPHTTYYYCAIVKSSAGTSYGSVVSYDTTNSLPTAVIDTPPGSITVTEGDTVSFSGSGTDPDAGDTIANYEWGTVCAVGGGSLSSDQSFDTNTLTSGALSPHTIYLMVQDSAGDWSTNCASVVVKVNPATGVICDPERISNCELPSTRSGNSGGSCAFGFSESCSYTCKSDGQWDTTTGTNSCAAIPIPDITMFKVCSPGAIDCKFPGETKLVNASDPLEVHWETSNATECHSTTGNFDTNKAKQGNALGNPVQTPNTTEKFEVSCAAALAGPSITASVLVKTRPAGPDLNVNKRIVKVGEDVELTWDTVNELPGNCRVTGGTVNINPLSAETGNTTTNVLAQTTYTLTCGGAFKDSVTVQVIGRGFEQ